MYPIPSSSFFSFFIIILFHYLLVLLTWSYMMVVFRDPGSVPDNLKLVSEEDLEEGNSTSVSHNLGPEIPASTLPSSDGTEIRPAVRYCNQCQNVKPPRCHHCSICQRCVLKMDHHCIWVVNCVGARNYKFFLLFVFYTFLETTLNTLVLLPSFINFFQQTKKHSLSPGNLAVTFLAFVLNLAFALSLLCFVIMHTSLLLSNTTSVEVYEKKKTVRWKYDLGRKRNFEQVFGTKKMLWFFPLFSEEDLKNISALHGIDFPIRSDTGESIRNCSLFLFRPVFLIIIAAQHCIFQLWSLAAALGPLYFMALCWSSFSSRAIRMPTMLATALPPRTWKILV